MAGPKRTTKAHRTQAICKGCGAGFRRGRKGNTFCSQPCYRKWRWKNVHKQKTLDAVVCKQCSESFVPTRRWQRFCSPKCRDKSHETPWGNARRGDGETMREFKSRIRTYRANVRKGWIGKQASRGSCRACKNKVINGTGSWCEKYWLVQAAWRNGFGASGASVSRLRDLLKRHNYSCSYTGKRLILGVNASIDHKNPRGRFPEQKSDWSNIEWVDLEVNRAKRLLTKREFIGLCRLITSRFRGK